MLHPVHHVSCSFSSKALFWHSQAEKKAFGYPTDAALKKICSDWAHSGYVFLSAQIVRDRVSRKRHFFITLSFKPAAACQKVSLLVPPYVQG